MNLKQELINKILLEASNNLRHVEDATGLLAEADAISERLRAHLPPDCCTGRATASVTSHHGVKVWVQINHVSRRHLDAAIAAAGLRIADDADDADAPRDYITIRLDGFDVPILTNAPRAALAEGAA